MPKEETNGDHILFKFKNGLPDGLQEIYYMDGKLFRTFDNFDGEKYGNRIEYNIMRMEQLEEKKSEKSG